MQLMSLADAVLPLIRSSSRELWRYNAAVDHGVQMGDGASILALALDAPDQLPEIVGVAVPTPKEVYTVTHKALASAIRVIARADDSSGIIGGVCHELIDLHARAAAAAQTPPLKLADWMFRFHFDDEVDYFNLDPVAYAPALGERGMARLREHIAELRERVGADKPDGFSHEWYLLSWFDQRLAVFDRDVDAIIRTHLRDGRVAAWFTNTAEALAEIDRFDLAIDWARRGMEFGLGHQSRAAADYWWELLTAHDPEALTEAAWTIFRRWPGEDTAARLDAQVGAGARPEILATLAARPDALVGFLVDTVHDVQAAWDTAHRLEVTSYSTWHRVARAYEAIDPVAAIGVHLTLVDASLEVANTRAYRPAAKELTRLRKLAATTGSTEAVDAMLADLRQRYRRRPALLAALDKARLP